MSLEPIGVLTILIGLVCLYLGTGALTRGTVTASVLGASSALFIGPANIPPGHVMLGVLALGAMTRRRESVAAIRSLHPNEPGFWFACLAIYGIASAFLMPRVLAGITEIFPLGTTVFDDTGSTVPLAPGSSNLAQSVYMASNLLCFVMIVGVASSRGGFAATLSGLIGYCVANTVFAFADLATYATGTQDLLGFMRNARYTLHTNSEVGGMKRIVGSFTEASVFARSTLGVFGFMGTLWLCGHRSVLTGTVAALSLLLIILSTSSTGLAGAPIVLCILYATAISRLGHGSSARHAAAVVFWAPPLAIAGLLLVLLDPAVATTIRDYVDMAVLDKAGSTSGIERSSWNVVSFQNFLDSWGLGVGLGTARASNFVIALLATTGIPGLFFYSIFAIECFARPRGEARSLDANVAVAARNGALGLLFGDLLVGTVIDQGLFFCALAATAAALRPRRRALRLLQPLGARA